MTNEAEVPAAETVKMPKLPSPITKSPYWDDGIDQPLAAERAARKERELQLKKALEWNASLNVELERGDSWHWIRSKFMSHRPVFTWYKPRTDVLVGTRYEVMGWLHLLFAHADPQIYIDITLEHQKKADDALAELTAAREEIRATRIKELEECYALAASGGITYIAKKIQALIDKERASNGRD